MNYVERKRKSTWSTFVFLSLILYIFKKFSVKSKANIVINDCFSVSIPPFGREEKDVEENSYPFLIYFALHFRPTKQHKHASYAHI